MGSYFYAYLDFGELGLTFFFVVYVQFARRITLAKKKGLSASASSSSTSKIAPNSPIAVHRSTPKKTKETANFVADDTALDFSSEHERQEDLEAASKSLVAPSRTHIRGV